MAARAPTRLLDHLPAIYRSGDPGDDLPALLRVFEEFFFVGHRQAHIQVHGIERQLDAVPALFAPLGLDDDAHGPSHDAERRTPERFVPWLATWLSFAPHHLFEPERLRHIVAGIVPLYGKRGTRAYLEELLKLCFDEIAAVHVDEQAEAGLRIGSSTLGVDSLLAEERPFWFSVDIHLSRDGMAPAASTGAMRLEQRVRAIIDFAKPAHTAYELRVRRANADAAAAASG